MLTNRGFAFLPIIIALVVVLGIGGGAYYVSQKQELAPVVAPVATSTPAVNNPSSAPVVVNSSVTADWKTYRDDKYGFEIKYPSDLFVKTTGGVGPIDWNTEIVPIDPKSSDGLNVRISVLFRTKFAQGKVNNIEQLGNAWNHIYTLGGGPALAKVVSVNGRQVVLVPRDVSGNGNMYMFLEKDLIFTVVLDSNTSQQGKSLREKDMNAILNSIKFFVPTVTIPPTEPASTSSTNIDWTAPVASSSTSNAVPRRDNRATQTFATLSGMRAGIAICCDDPQHVLNTVAGDLCTPNISYTLASVADLHLSAANASVSYRVSGSCATNNPGYTATIFGHPVGACNGVWSITQTLVTPPAGC